MDHSFELKDKEKDASQTDRASVDGTIWKKLDRWILPLLTIFFLLAAVDRINIGNTRVAGLQTSLGMSNYQFTLALTVTSVPLIVIQLPCTLLLKSVGPNIMLPTMVTLWGIASAAQGLVKNYSQLLVCRFFLGLIEGGLFPGIVLYLSVFYPRRMLQVRMAIFFTAISLTGAFSGLLAAAIAQMDGVGGKPGWAWIFILEGIFSFVFGLIAFLLLPRSPQTTRFLIKEERAYVVSTLKDAGSVSEEDDDDSFRWKEVIESIRSPHVWLLIILTFFNGAEVIGLAYFEPTIVSGLGYTGNRAQLMSAPPFAVSFVLSIVSSIISDRYQCRGYTTIFFSIWQVIGFSMFYASKSNHVRYASLFFSLPGAYCASPPQATWLANNSAPHARRATAVAMCTLAAETGGLLITWVLGALSSAPDFRPASITFIAMSTAATVVATINLLYVRQQNQKKAERRQRIRKEEEPEGLGDRSAWFVYSL